MQLKLLLGNLKISWLQGAVKTYKINLKKMEFTVKALRITLQFDLKMACFKF